MADQQQQPETPASAPPEGLTPVRQLPTLPPEGFTAAVEATVRAYLDAHLPDLVAAAMPPSPEQQAQKARDSYEETVRKQAAAAARKAKREQAAREKAEAEAAREQAKRDAAAAAEFEGAVPFIGNVTDITAAILRDIRIDDGKAYSADVRIPVRMGDLEATSEGALLLTKPIELAGRGREFVVRGVSLITDAGVLRTALNGTRKVGNGNGLQFPAKSMVFRPGRPPADAGQQG